MNQLNRLFTTTNQRGAAVSWFITTVLCGYIAWYAYHLGDVIGTMNDMFTATSFKQSLVMALVLKLTRWPAAICGIVLIVLLAVKEAMLKKWETRLAINVAVFVILELFYYFVVWQIFHSIEKSIL
jgi:hypothetical protein